MLRTRILMAGALALTILGGCTAPAPSPSPTAPSVVVHWDAVEPPAAPKVARWYEAYTDDLIPSPDYGPLVPYPGTSASIPQWGTELLFGLATQDGVVVTDPVFSRATMPSYYDIASNTFHTLPLLVLQVPGADEVGAPMYQCGLAAADGSWYSGQVYTSHVCTTSFGVLMTDGAGDVVMVDTQGEEIFRWPAQDIPLSDFEVSPYYYAVIDISGPYLCWDGGLEGDALQYADLRIGTVYTQRPADLPQPADYSEEGPLPEGKYRLQDNILTVQYGGEPHTIPISPDVDQVLVDGDRVILSLLSDTDYGYCQLMDLEGQVLLTLEEYPLQFVEQMGPDAPTLVSYLIYHEDSYENQPNYTTVVLTRDGRPLLTAQNWVYQFGGRLLYATPGAYHMADLEGNELLCLPRLDG